MLRIVMDGAGDMPLEWAAEYDILVIPINIHFREETFLQGIDLSNKDFYDMVTRNGVIPKTSQPSPQQFIDFYRKNALPGDTILSIHVTRHLSGTFASAEMAARELEGEFRVIPIDSASGSVAQGFMCREARLLDRNGVSIDEIVQRMEYIRRNIQIILTLNTLDYARMSGRVKTLQAALASLLDVKPTVILEDGVLDVADRVRTRGKAIERIVAEMHKRIGERLSNIGVVHAEDPEAGAKLLERVKQVFNYQDLVMTELSIAVAANLGPGTVGIVAYPLEEG